MLKPEQVIDRYYLDTRCMLLEIAATLDRHDRAAADERAASADERLQRIYRSLEILADRDAAPDRAEKLLLLFSDPVE